MNKIFLFALLALIVNSLLTFGAASDAEEGSTRVKRGYGGGGGHGHGPGRGGGASGPVYFCGYVGKSEGYGGYGK